MPISLASCERSAVMRSRVICSQDPRRMSRLSTGSQREWELGVDECCQDAHMRFRQTVYGTVADAEFGPTCLLARTRTHNYLPVLEPSKRGSASKLCSGSRTDHPREYLPELAWAC